MSQASTIEDITSSLSDNKIHLLVAASGSVATIKLPLIVKTLSEKYAQPHNSPQPSSSSPQQQQQDGTTSTTTSDTSSPPSHGGLSIRLLLTPSASRFLAGQSAEQPHLQSLLSIPGVDGIHLDEDEWREPWKRGNAILHIELRRWADMLVIAPLSANTMAKVVNGFADGILTSVVRAWDARGELDSDVVRGVGADASSIDIAGARQRRSRKKRIIVAPAMNTAMWRHPVTAKQLRVLEEEWGVGPADDIQSRTGDDNALSSEPKNDVEDVDRSLVHLAGNSSEEQKRDGWFEVLRPQHKVLACGDVGDGAMMEWTEIVAVIEARLGLRIGTH